MISPGFSWMNSMSCRPALGVGQRPKPASGPGAPLAGVDVQLEDIPDTFHGFDTFIGKGISKAMV